MLSIAYLDGASGISGDMTLGALVDAGVPLDEIQRQVDSLGLPDCRLVARSVLRHGFRATKVDVQHAPEHAHRHLRSIIEMIDGSTLTPRQKALATDIFTRLGEAEAKVHGTPLDEIHFHEVGAVDSIADIVGAAVGWDLLSVDMICASPIATGSGFVEIAHGRVSIPAPATAELLRGIPLASSLVTAELTTPTGAAIVATLVDTFGPLPAMTIDRIGYGAGSRDFPTQANVLRLLVGHTDGDADQGSICVLETNLDDVTGEVVAHCAQRLFHAGALDVTTTPIQMKKNRPGVTLTLLCDESQRTTMESILFQETTTLGVRWWTAQRTTLARRTHTVTTEWGPVAGKIAKLPDGSERFSPEYDACQRVAIERNLPVQRVLEVARQAFDRNA